MGKVDCFSMAGVDCWFYSNDHRPPHFNAKKKGQWCFKVFFLEHRDRMLKREKSLRGRISRKDRNALCAMAELYREDLLKEWEEKVNEPDSQNKT